MRKDRELRGKKKESAGSGPFPATDKWSVGRGSGSLLGKARRHITVALATACPR